MAIIFNNEQDKFAVDPDWQEEMQQLAEMCLKSEGIDDDVEIGLIFTDNEGIREINREYRDIDSATDVLSFPMYEADEELECGEIVLFGDIMISLERAEEQCQEYGHSFKREVFYLLTHGLLHLCGYDHMTDEDKMQMRTKEEEMLGKMNLTR